MDAAIFSASLGKIIGVRANWIFIFNADTGAKEKEFRFVNGVVGEASVTELGGFFYVATDTGLFWNPNTSPARTGEDIYKVNSTLTTSVSLGLNGASFADYAGLSPNQRAGFVSIVNDGTFLYGVERGGAALFRVDPSNAVATWEYGYSIFENAPYFGMEYDSENGLVWFSNTLDSNMVVSDSDFGTNDTRESTPNSTMDQILGLSRVPITNKVYGAAGTAAIYKANGNQALPKPGLNHFTFSTLNILQAAAKPARLKYNPVDGLIYIPTTSGDTVEVLNPATDTIVSVKTGFSDPWDIVCTPTKKWAVQRSSTALRLIT